MNCHGLLSSIIAALFFLTLPSSLVDAANYFSLCGARSAALSHSSVTLSDGWSSFNNQAGLAFLKRPTASMSIENRFNAKEFSTKAGAFALPLQPGTMALSFMHFGYQLYSETKAGLAMSRKFTNHFAAGIQFNFLQKHLAEGYGNYNSFATEFSLLGQPDENLTIGFHLFNPIPFKKETISEAQVPTIGRLGVNYKIGTVLLLSETEIITKQNAIYKIGIEVEALKKLFFRAGYATGWEQYSLGIGYCWRAFAFDLAFARHQVLGFSPNISLGYEF